MSGGLQYCVVLLCDGKHKRRFRDALPSGGVGSVRGGQQRCVVLSCIVLRALLDRYLRDFRPLRP